MKAHRTQENIQDKPVKWCDDTDTDSSLPDTCTQNDNNKIEHLLMNRTCRTTYFTIS